PVPGRCDPAGQYRRDLEPGEAGFPYPTPPGTRGRSGLGYAGLCRGPPPMGRSGLPAPLGRPARRTGRHPVSPWTFSCEVSLGLGVACRLGVAFDVDTPPGQLGGQAGVLAVATDGQGELVPGYSDVGGPRVRVYLHRGDPGRTQGGGHEAGGVRVPGDDVDVLLSQLGE